MYGCMYVYSYIYEKTGNKSSCMKMYKYKKTQGLQRMI